LHKPRGDKDTAKAKWVLLWEPFIDWPYVLEQAHLRRCTYGTREINKTEGCFKST